MAPFPTHSGSPVLFRDSACNQRHRLHFRRGFTTAIYTSNNIPLQTIFANYRAPHLVLLILIPLLPLTLSFLSVFLTLLYVSSINSGFPVCSPNTLQPSEQLLNISKQDNVQTDPEETLPVVFLLLHLFSSPSVLYTSRQDLANSPQALSEPPPFTAQLWVSKQISP